MNREYIVLVVFLVVTIFSAGYVISIQDSRELKEFNSSGISFVYPAEYNFKILNNTTETLIIGNANNKSFNISKTSVNTSFTDYTTNLKNNISKDNFYHEQMMTIDGVQVYQILYIPIPPLGNFFPRNTIIVLDKNDTRYILYFSGEETLKDIPIIEKSLKLY
jgi:hypothetical protein